jgi:hypothetical protein
MRLFHLIAVACLASLLVALATSAAPAPNKWDQPAASLAEQIAGMLGPGQAHLTIRNLSTISTDEIPAIRRLLESDLKSHGVIASGAESANIIRVTLSENVRERLWVAEVVEGNETRVVMVHVDPEATRTLPSQTEIVLSKKRVWASADVASGTSSPSKEPVLALIETDAGLVVLEKEQIIVFSKTTAQWQEEKRFDIGQRSPLSGDPHGMLLPSADGSGFFAYTQGSECAGSYVDPAADSRQVEWSIHCRESDDPWPITPTHVAQASSATEEDVSATPIRAFYHAARNYFTGIVTPNLGVDLPPFYSIAVVPRPTSDAALLLSGIDGKVQLVEKGALKPVAGTRDWGSDFAVLHSGCGAGTQIVASGSGEATSDSLRVYEIPAQEAIPASTPLAMDGTVTAIWTAPDNMSVLAVVQSAADQYEVDRVTASCN